MTITKAGRKLMADLQIQSMLFDMSIDWESLTLEEKRKDNVPIWIKRWRDKEAGGDRQPNDYEGGKDDAPREPK